MALGDIFFQNGYLFFNFTRKFVFNNSLPVKFIIDLTVGSYNKITYKERANKTKNQSIALGQHAKPNFVLDFYRNAESVTQCLIDRMHDYIFIFN